MTALLDKLGSEEPVGQNVFSWSIMDRTRKSATYTALANGTTATATLTLDIAAASPNLGYFQVGDVIRIGKTGALGRVSAIGIAGGFQTIDVTRPDGSNWSTTPLPAVTSGDVIGHVFTQFGEGTNGPDGRLFLPDEDSNYTQIIKRSMKITGSAMASRTWLGDGKAWYFEVENILMKEFARDREMLVMFGQKSSTSGSTWTRGIYDWVNTSGQLRTFSSAVGVSESDLQALITTLNYEGGSDDLLVLCGGQFYSDVQKALKDYRIVGHIPGSIGEKMAGLKFDSYSFANKSIHFVHYELFNDTAALPYIGTPSSTAVNFRNFSLWLDMGKTDNGEPLIKLCYRALGGAQRKFIHTVIPGMMKFDGDNDGGFASNSFDGVEVQMLSEIGVKLQLPNRMAICRASS